MGKIEIHKAAQREKQKMALDHARELADHQEEAMHAEDYSEGKAASEARIHLLHSSLESVTQERDYLERQIDSIKKKKAIDTQLLKEAQGELKRSETNVKKLQLKLDEFHEMQMAKNFSMHDDESEDQKDIEGFTERISELELQI